MFKAMWNETLTDYIVNAKAMVIVCIEAQDTAGIETWLANVEAAQIEHAERFGDRH